MSQAITERRTYREGATRRLEQTLNDVGATEWLELRGELAVQFSGAATNISAVVERSTRDPGNVNGPDTVPAGSAIVGNPSAGMAPKGYRNPGYAFWRVRLTAAPTGGPVTIVITGDGL